MFAKIIPAVVLMLIPPGIFSQSDNYLVTRAPFSSQKFDEFSPVLYRNSIVFCSNRNPSKIVGYSAPGKKGFFKVYYIDTAGLNREARLLKGSINSQLNNGPVTFSRSGDTIYFSRNLIVDGSFREITGSENKLGLFYAVLKNGEWTNVTEMRFNDNSWNVTTPYISPDGKRLYFASDRPEGFGGSDLWYSSWENGYWNNPVNLGESLNTGGNEAYPFVNEDGNLFFSSDSLPGLGGKDIFFSTFVDSAWLKPVGLNAPVNSKADDFGFFSDNLMAKGYFSSDREGMLDIYAFKTIFPQFLNCEQQKKAETCFIFTDDNSIEFDPQELLVKWSFGDGTGASGPSARHCYSKPGRYEVRENITDRRSGKTVMNKLIMFVGVKDIENPYIESPEQIVINSPTNFSVKPQAGTEILSAYWDFGSFGKEKGQSVTKAFGRDGDIPVSLLVNIKNSGTGKLSRRCVTKTVRVSEKTGMQSRENNSASYYTVDTRKSSGNPAEIKYSAGDDLAGNGVFQVSVFTSEKKIAAGDRILRNLETFYPITVRETQDQKYIYVVDEQLTFNDAYQSYHSAVESGFRDAFVTTYMPSGVSLLLWNFKKTFGVSADRYFVNNGYSLSPSMVPALDELVMILKRYPGQNIHIAVHTDGSVSQTESQLLTQRQAQSIADYLVEAGIAKSRLTARGVRFFTTFIRILSGVGKCKKPKSGFYTC